jgi:cytochrome P450
MNFCSSSEGTAMTMRTGGQTAALSTGALFDEIPALQHLDPADPYDAYREIAGAPLVVAGGDVVILTRYADCNRVLRHPDVSLRRNVTPAFRGLSSSFLNVLDPPEHTRIRSIVNKAFLPRSVDLLRPWLQDQVHALLDAGSAAAPFDVIAGLAYPLPVNAICELLGVPIEDRHMITTWSRPITLGADLLAGRRSRDDQLLYRSTLRQFRLYMQDLVKQRQQSPGGDLLSRLILTEEMGERLTEREVITTAMGLLVTGHETTVSLIGHGAIALARHPVLRERVEGEESFADSFVEELLRYDSPVQATLRVAARDLSVGGVDVRAGSAILVLLGAANRDPDQFSEPDTFDVDRTNNRTHLAFGGGPHYCVGASLGRLEARIALAAMAARLVNPRQRPDGVRYDKSVMLRAQTRLEIDVDAVLPRPRTAVWN